MKKKTEQNNIVKKGNNTEKIEQKDNFDKLPILKIQNSSCYPTASYCYFLISIGLFILGCQAIGWCEYGSNFINSAFLFLGICQYILGLFDWYQRNNLLFVQNIVFGLWYMCIFLNDFEMNGVKKTKHFFSGIQGVIDLLMILFISVIIIIVKGRGIAYIIDYFLLFFCFAFLALCGYSKDYVIVIRIGGYIFFVGFLFFWMTGICLIINDVFKNNIIKFVEPRLQ